MPLSEQRLAQIAAAFFAVFALFPSISVKGQEAPQPVNNRKKVELIYSDVGLIDRKQNMMRLLGNVSLKHNEIFMLCDSAHLFQSENKVKAFSRVHIKQGDTLDIYGAYLYYDGIEESALLEGNVELIDKETHLYTNSVNYDVKTEMASYTQKGKIVNGENTLTSIKGIYYAAEKMFHFKDSVKIVNPDYTMTADTMQYNTQTETAWFIGPSELMGDSLYIYCEKGWYDTKNNVTRIWKNSLIDNRQQLIKGDSLHYDDNKGYGEAWRNISITDTTNNIIVSGNYALYYKDPERFTVTGRALFTQVSKDDSLFMHSDTIKAVTLTGINGEKYRLMRAFYGVRIFSPNLQSKCDSLSYSFQDSVIRLYRDPVIWSEVNQLTSDSIAIFTKNRKADRMELYNSAFITSGVDSLRYNQIKGRTLKGYFRDNELYKVRIEGNGETIYFLADKDKLIGVNHATSSSIEILVENGKINEIVEFQNPDGKLDPPMLAPPSRLRLKGFAWHQGIRPVNKNDVFRK
jgi:lipopolysaccharide assembly outer membrane protein LptD (OstA)